MSGLFPSRIAAKRDAGAIYSIVSFLACVAPKMTFQLYGIIPVPAWLLVTGLFSYDLYRTVKKEVCVLLLQDVCLTFRSKERRTLLDISEACSQVVCIC